MIAGGIQTDAPGYVHLNVEEAVTLSTDPAYMGVLILTLSPLTALCVVMDNIYQTKRVQTVQVIVKTMLRVTS